MPPSTVTVRAVASNATILAIGRTERNSSVLFAIVLKQCRVPSTFSLLCFGTNSRTCSSDSAEYKRSVPYSRLPAQFFSFSSGIAAINGERIGLAAIAEESLINVLLFMVSHQTRKKSPRSHHQMIQPKLKSLMHKLAKSDPLQHRSKRFHRNPF